MVRSAVAIAAQLVLATVFLWAALSKARTVAALRGTVERLGVPALVARPLAPVVVVAEFVAAVALLVGPAPMWPRLVVAGLAVAFGVAGLTAVATGRRVACACFGNVGQGRLGWRQVHLLPLWVGLAVVAQWQPPAWSVNTGLVLMAVLLLVFLAIRLPAELKVLRHLRGDRLAIHPMYANAGEETR